MPVDPKIVDKDLNEIENLINRLKLEWDRFFGGGSKTPPWQLQKDIERRLNAYKDTSELAYYHKFRINTINGKFTNMKEKCEKMLHYKDEGLTVYGKQITKTPSPPVPESKSPIITEKKQLSDYQNLYEAYIQARKKCGESISQLTYDSFT